MRASRLFFLSFPLLAAALLCSHAAWAAPANPFPKTFTQPDGSTFAGRLRGDEFQHWREEEATGRAVVRSDATGFWEYALPSENGRRLEASGVAVALGNAPPAASAPGLRPARDTAREATFQALLREDALLRGGRIAAGKWVPPPSQGNRTLLVILVSFTNQSFSVPPADWAPQVFSREAGAKSVAGYYDDISNATYSIFPAAHSQPGMPPGVVSVAINQLHPNSASGNTYSAEVSWLNAALAAAASHVDFDAFDTNRNHVLEGEELYLSFIAAGYEASGSDYTPSVWAHAWGGTPGITPGGALYAERWAVQGELYDPGIMMTMGVTVHEFGHLGLALPDLYDTSDETNGLGGYSVMSSGSWGTTVSDSFHGETPVVLDAWSRYHLGWASPLSHDEQGLISFPPAASSAQSFYLLINPTRSSTEYWLVENRPQVSWDRGLEIFLDRYTWDGGLLILHADDGVGSNSTGLPLGLAAEEADSGECTLAGSKTCYGSIFHLFWEENSTEFTPATSPSSIYHSGISSNLALTEISAPGSVMTARIDLSSLPTTLEVGLGRAFGGAGGGDGGCFLELLRAAP